MIYGLCVIFKYELYINFLIKILENGKVINYNTECFVSSLIRKFIKYIHEIFITAGFYNKKQKQETFKSPKKI